MMREKMVAKGDGPCAKAKTRAETIMDKMPMGDGLILGAVYRNKPLWLNNSVVAPFCFTRVNRC